MKKKKKFCADKMKRKQQKFEVEIRRNVTQTKLKCNLANNVCTIVS